MQSRLFRSSSLTVYPIKKAICSEIENLLHGCFIIFSRIYYCFVSKQNEAKRKQKKLSEIGKQLLRAVFVALQDSCRLLCRLLFYQIHLKSIKSAFLFLK